MADMTTREDFETAMGALADIAFADDMTLEIARSKAKRIYEALRLAARQDVLSNNEFVQFLNGAGPLDGVWFGDEHPKYKGKFWWRAFLRARQDQSVSTLTMVLDECVKASGEEIPYGDLPGYIAELRARLERERALENSEQRVRELERVAEHYFVTPPVSESDPHLETCSVCGLNLRDPIHKRAARAQEKGEGHD